MRLISPAVFLTALLALPALAQTPAVQTPAVQTPASPPPVASPPAVASPTTPPSLAPRAKPRMTFRQRFAAANTTHDGHLTKAQASAARMTLTVRHFDEIDTGKKGYVTAEEIDAYAKAQRAARKTTPKP